ncbi:MAG: DNA (cytosine-5-)-methyltransferase [Pseudomonas stutzeri]|nr:DNA (cytosine-5-)-methyltransferase [Stutzerimonas stutzeri]NIM57276.1 DNA (cytosine-5-)-methyltransferase [Stutzerimonas stutzeri]NIM86560.1 DNA (cytosine-5-)-methyltransferase [Stutzerimonas stutzeri]NIN81162.1 DNA (cytosine-5-)-methyltransferase [Stutzerimonas stutzeri]NIP00408.1 DNA (cytosine-5-)-methyltransferase [Stutzerimonas stutzeri]
MAKSNEKNDSKPLAIDLFCGCGGVTAGLIEAGFNVVSAIEIDKKAAETYRANYPNVYLLEEDIRKVDVSALAERLRIAPGELDLLAGCPPCQGFSRIRKLNKTRPAIDERNALIEEFERFVLGLKPKRVMLENVPGLVTHYRFQRFVTRLKRDGYFVTYQVVDVSDYGVPQRRKRLILTASVDGVAALPAVIGRKVTVREAISHLQPPGKSGDQLHDLPEKRSEKVKEIIKNIPKNGGSRADLPERLVLECHKQTNGFSDVYGRMRWDDVAPTITSGCHNPSKGRFLHPLADRTISLREAAILQGFPEDYKFIVSHGKESIALMIGNALPPIFIKAHAEAIAATL